MASISFYAFETDWYAEGLECDKHSKGIVAATSLVEAVEKISRRLPYTNNLFIQELDDWDFIFMDNEHFDLVKREGIGAFDESEEMDNVEDEFYTEGRDEDEHDTVYMETIFQNDEDEDEEFNDLYPDDGRYRCI